MEIISYVDHDDCYVPIGATLHHVTTGKHASMLERTAIYMNRLPNLARCHPNTHKHLHRNMAIAASNLDALYVVGFRCENGTPMGIDGRCGTSWTAHAVTCPVYMYDMRMRQWISWSWCDGGKWHTVEDAPPRPTSFARWGAVGSRSMTADGLFEIVMCFVEPHTFV